MSSETKAAFEQQLLESPSRALFADILAAFPTLPTGVSHPPYQSTAIDFFPGGTGMCVQNAPFPVGGVMILGHNYGNDLDFSRNVHSPETSWHDSIWSTCRNTYIALRRWGIEPATCFFTNFYPGYVTTRDEDERPFNVGPHPHAGNAAFVRASREFFVRQVRAQRPRAVLVLGAQVPPLLAPLDSRLGAWSPWPGVAALDVSGGSIVRGLTLGGHMFNMCVVAHPSIPNARHRSYGALQGAKAEEAIVRATVDGDGNEPWLPVRAGPSLKRESHFAEPLLSCPDKDATPIFEFVEIEN
jgi:hypothetical protein